MDSKFCVHSEKYKNHMSKIYRNSLSWQKKPPPFITIFEQTEILSHIRLYATLQIILDPLA